MVLRLFCWLLKLLGFGVPVIALGSCCSADPAERERFLERRRRFRVKLREAADVWRTAEEPPAAGTSGTATGSADPLED